MVSQNKEKPVVKSFRRTKNLWKYLLFKGIGIALSVASPLCAMCQELTENNAAQWGTFASDNTPTNVSNDTMYVKVGSSSLRFDTQSGFDTGVRYPSTP